MEKKIELRNVGTGDITYGERIQLEHILRAEMGDYERIHAVIECLHDIDITPDNAVALAPYVERVLTDITGLIEREQKELYLPPTNEELEAGIEELAKACGEVGNTVNLAEKFQCTFEEIYKRPYLEIFAIQKVGVERTKYERRLNKVYSRKKN